MSQMLLVNPRRRRKRKARARRANPRRKRRTKSRRRRNPGFALPTLGNPRRRKRRRSHAKRLHRRRNPSSRRGFRLSVNGIKGQITGAVPGALGALALDVTLGYLPVPEAWKGGIAGYVVKAAAAIGLGMVAAKVVKGSTAAKMTEGALTVMLYGIARGMTAQYAPGVKLGDYEGAGWNPSVPLSAYLNPGMGAYLPDMNTDVSGGQYLDPSMSAYTDQDYM